ncbi:cytochrome P450 [Actinocorallia sp. B10E7]|uniref:cytochrome P450 n=1 Tax=Actinocorallia sp. B10E7 TaxID=3153558 RepID=UPI00325E3FA3
MTAQDFDHHSTHYAENWREINAELRATCPVARSEAHGGFWVVSRYDDVSTVVHDDTTFSSYQELPDGSHLGVTVPVTAIRQVPIEMDPPEFHTYRKLLTPWFSPGKAEQWRPYLEEAVTFCVDRVIESGTADFMSDIAGPVPAILTLKLLGLPTDDWQKFSAAVHASIHSVPGTPENDAAVAQIMALMGQVQEAVVQRRAEPADDLISALVHSEVDGAPLSDQRLMEMISLVIYGGIDTTSALTGSVLEWLARHPEERARLRENPELIPQATEEFLRYFSPVQALSRTATRACELGGQQIKAGDQVLMSWSSANFDETMFDRPDEVVLDRFPNRHQAFGLGIHRCLGSNLARVEFGVILQEVLRRMPDYTIEASAGRYSTIGVVNGWATLPATFTPGTREGSGVLA